MAFAYEWGDDPTGGAHTDYLIIGEKGKVFSGHGDSGKLIVTDDTKHNAVALLWGGWFERLRSGHGQENKTYAIDMNKVLDKLDVEILADPSPAPGPGESVRCRTKKVSRAEQGT